MATWITLLRTVAPELAKIVAAAAPAFTVRQGMVGQQITELQQAVLRNAAAIKEVAEESQHMAKALEELVAANQALTASNHAAAVRLRQARSLAIAALAAAIIAVVIAVTVAAVQ